MFLHSLGKAIRLRLGTKSILAVILLLSTISILLTTFFVSRLRSSLTEELRKRAFSLASNMAFNSQYAVLSRDMKTLSNLLAGMKKESDIEEAYITDLEGTILAHQTAAQTGRRVGFFFELDTLQTEKWVPAEQENLRRTIALIEIERRSADLNEVLLFSSPESGDFSENRTPSISYREKLGFVVLEVSLESMNRALATGTRHAVVITLIMLLAGALAAIVMVRSLAGPIYRLVDATRAVAQDNLDQFVQIKRSDEIGILADSFNHMLRQLKASREKIEAWNRELEAKVSERTKELKEKHYELEKAYEELKTLDKAKDDFLSLVSHELRTPLSSILLYSEMLLDGLADSEETRTEFLTTVVENCKRLTRLINDVLDLSKIESGRMSFKIAELNVKELVAETLSGIRPAIESKGIHFEYRDMDEQARLLGDRDKVIQVLTNIISNAIKFTPEGGGITVLLSESKEKGEIAVKDTGKGIRKEDLSKVFDRFRQIESIEHHSTGSGLGMTISKSIIERLGGRIWIESEPGLGTTVFFTLPKAKRFSGTKTGKIFEHGAQSK